MTAGGHDTVNRDGRSALHITMVLPSSFEKAPTRGQVWCRHLTCRPWWWLVTPVTVTSNSGRQWQSSVF